MMRLAGRWQDRARAGSLKAVTAQEIGGERGQRRGMVDEIWLGLSSE